MRGTPDHYTAKGRRFDSVVKYLMGGDVPLRLEHLRLRYLANLNYRERDVEREMLPVRRAASTQHVRYRIDPGLGLSEEELNARVRRLGPAGGARSRATDPVYAEPTGRITVPLLTLHETGDAWVPLSLEQSYRRRTLQAGTDGLLVQRVVRRGSHCAIDREIRERALDDLVGWIERGVRPEGEDVLGDVTRLGLRFTPTLFPNDPLAPKS